MIAMVPSIVAISCIAPRVTIAAINRRDGRLVRQVAAHLRPSIAGFTGIGSLIPRALSSSEVKGSPVSS